MQKRGNFINSPSLFYCSSTAFRVFRMIAEWSLNGNWKWLLRSSRRDLLVVRAAIYSQVSRVALERNLFASEPTAQCVGIKRKLGDNKKNFYCNLPNSRQHLAYKGTIKGYHPNLLFFIRIFLLIKQISMKQNCSFSALGECSEPRTFRDPPPSRDSL